MRLCVNSTPSIERMSLGEANGVEQTPERLSFGYDIPHFLISLSPTIPSTDAASHPFLYATHLIRTGILETEPDGTVR